MNPNHKISGWIVLDKPYGMSSTLASNLVRRLAGAAKAGHAGTLDPLATGILPIALGEATKAIPYIMEGMKQYRFQVIWGEQRTTDDAQGTISAVSANRPLAEAIEAALPRFTGVIPQRPPLFSALKVEGKRAYELARSGESLNLNALEAAIACKERYVTISALVLESVDSLDHATFLVTCGSGTYVRSLARDMAALLGTKGYVSALRRLCVGKFHERDAISLEKLRELGHKSELHRIILPIGAVLDDIPAAPITREEAVKVQQGQRIFKASEGFEGLSPVVLWVGDKALAIAQAMKNEDGQNFWLYPKRLFNIDF